jgi:hypothetical protein
MVSSRFSELFIRMEMLNIGQQISPMHQNPTENRSKISGGTSKYTTVALSSVAVSRDARDLKEIVQRGHIFLSLLAFLRLETQRLHTGISWYESKRSIHRTATSRFISQPTF